MKRTLLLLALVAMLAIVARAEEPESAEEVPGVFKNERGMWMVREGENLWYVLDDAKHGKHYFFDANRNISQWHDPRGPHPGEKITTHKRAVNVKGNYKNNRGQYLLEHEGNHWYIIDDEKHGQPYFFDANRNVSQWEDPRGANYDTFGTTHSEL